MINQIKQYFENFYFDIFFIDRFNITSSRSFNNSKFFRQKKIDKKNNFRYELSRVRTNFYAEKILLTRKIKEKKIKLFLLKLTLRPLGKIIYLFQIIYKYLNLFYCYLPKKYQFGTYISINKKIRRRPLKKNMKQTPITCIIDNFTLFDDIDLKDLNFGARIFYYNVLCPIHQRFEPYTPIESYMKQRSFNNFKFTPFKKIYDSTRLKRDLKLLIFVIWRKIKLMLKLKKN